MYVTCTQAESIAASILCSSQLYSALVCFFFGWELNIVRVDLNSVIKSYFLVSAAFFLLMQNIVSCSRLLVFIETFELRRRASNTVGKKSVVDVLSIVCGP